MPSFVCDRCQETIKKPKLDTHVQRCRGASFSCIDCYKVFKGAEYRSHFSCISEVEKYEKKKPQGIAEKNHPDRPADSPSKRPKVLESPKQTDATTVSPKGDDLKTTTLKGLLKEFSKPVSLKELKKAIKKTDGSNLTKKDLKRLLIKRILISLKNGEFVLSLE